MAHAMMKVMTQPNSSILYNLASFSTSTAYNGMVHNRPGKARMSQHATATSDEHPVELKCRGLKAAGGAAAWYFIPAVAGATVPKRQLAALEDIAIGSHSNIWNDAGKNHRQPLHASWHHSNKVQKPMMRVVRLEAYMYTLQGGNLMLEADSEARNV